MINVSRYLMTDYKPEFGFANFFAKVVKFIQTEQDIEQATRMELEKKTNVLTRLCFDADILIINTDDDNEYATRIKEEAKGWNISVHIESEVAIGRPIFSSIGDALNRYLFVFVIVTESLTGDKVQRFASQGHLHQSVLDNKDRFIPVKIIGQEHVDSVFGILFPWTYGTKRSGENLNSLVQRANGIVFN
ncbi:uncharacterized protein LOC132750773 [Ruditapes philippinarum]|uniref:uncharacterized protein LOC132750773 n=1 Tax=Ruditapes philippinarum TaxID=129788 RepID=UPI00295BA5E0|nr:uncharacterized protein LOC132750773 [Ruditapes philippinarum]